LEAARRVLLAYVDRREAALRSGDPEDVPALEFYLALQCCRVLRSLFSARSEKLAGHSTTEALWRAARGELEELSPVPTEGFWQEIYHLFLGALARTKVYEGAKTPLFLNLSGREAGRERSRELDRLGGYVESWVKRYPDGLSDEAIRRREVNRRRILSLLGASLSDWQRYEWQLKHIVRDEQALGRIIKLTEQEREAIRKARDHNFPFSVTPYSVSLMDYESDRRRDHSIRAQVIPPLDYSDLMWAVSMEGPQALDFMGEYDTSPVDLVTRRYPQVAILKPFNTCAQICVYCQRNWEVQEAMGSGGAVSRESLAQALEWFKRQSVLREVLITGGDPLLLPDETIEWLLDEFYRMPHISRVRFGTRVPVVLPMRITPRLVNVFAKYHHEERCAICVVTHFEHPYEVTPDVRQATERIRRVGMNIYNQQVYTIENSRKFETVALRYALKEVGIEPYYCFNTKGKDETRYYRVPVARILQERKEEARLTPGTVRTDDPVFNLPRLGKNALRAGQDHHVVGLQPDGGRIYEFLPWEKNLYPSPTYIYHDVPIFDFLQRLQRRGANPRDYRNIWYYF
jgi:lysine 2,3-aminomutase